MHSLGGKLRGRELQERTGLEIRRKWEKINFGRYALVIAIKGKVATSKYCEALLSEKYNRSLCLTIYDDVVRI